MFNTHWICFVWTDFVEIGIEKPDEECSRISLTSFALDVLLFSNFQVKICHTRNRLLIEKNIDKTFFFQIKVLTIHKDQWVYAIYGYWEVEPNGFLLP